MNIQEVKQILINWCNAQVGTREGANNWNKYAEDLGLVEVIGVAAAFAIPAEGSSVSYNLAGLTADHELSRWNFSTSAENDAPAKLMWTTYAGYFTITNNGGTTSESMRPVFELPTKKAATTQ